MDLGIHLVQGSHESESFTFFDKDSLAEQITSLYQRRCATHVDAAPAAAATSPTAPAFRNRVICIAHQCENETAPVPTADIKTDAKESNNNCFHVALFEEMTRSYHHLLLLQHRRFLSEMATLLHHEYYAAYARDEALRNVAEEQQQREAQFLRVQQRCATQEAEMEQLRQDQELAHKKENVLVEHVRLLEQQVRDGARREEELRETLQQERAQRSRVLQQCQAREAELVRQCEEEKAYSMGELSLLRREVEERVRHDAQRELTIAVQAQELREMQQVLLLLHDFCGVTAAAAQEDDDDGHASALLRNVNVDYTTNFMFLSDPSTSKVVRTAQDGTTKRGPRGQRLREEERDGRELAEALLLHLRRRTIDRCCAERCGEAVQDYLFRDAAERRKLIAHIADEQWAGGATERPPLASRQFVRVMQSLLSRLRHYKSRMHEKAEIIKQKADEDKQSGGGAGTCGKYGRKSTLCDFSGRTYHQMTYQTCFQPLEKQLDGILDYVERVLNGEIEGPQQNEK